VSPYQQEKKSLGRGLEDISNTFLSSNAQTKNENMYHGFSSFAIREALCSSCINVVEDKSGFLKCKIFTFENENYKVKYLESVTPDQAKYCEFFKSSSPIKEKTTLENEVNDSDQTGVQCEVEETVTVKKKIAYQNIGNVQQKMRIALSKHIQEGYSIKQVLLRKTEEISSSSKRERRNEEVIIYAKAPETK
jgi:hypothetical protein